MTSSAGLREEIERSFLLEDYSAAEKLSRDYHSVSEEDRREVSYLRAVCFLKLRRPNDARPILESLLANAKTEREKARFAASLVQTQPQTKPFVQLPVSTPLRQHAVEESPRFSVQVGSFSKEKNARSLLRQLSGRHYEAFLDTSAASLYRVRVGPLPSHEEAVRLEALLKKDGYPTKIFP